MSEEKGGVSALELAAIRGEPMPDGLSLIDQTFFQGLARVYQRYRSGFITREQGSVEKRQMEYARRRALDRTALADRQRRRSVQLWKDVERWAAEYVKARKAGDGGAALSAGDRIWEAIYGMPFPVEEGAAKP